jgi:hypothetical protein
MACERKAVAKKQLRDRLTVGRDALNVLMLVRFQLPQFTEVIRPDEDAVLKTVGRKRDLWVRVPRLPLNGLMVQQEDISSAR